MKFLNEQYYVEVKDKRYRIHPTENNILRELDPPKPLRTQNQVQNETQIRKNQKAIRNDKNELVVKNYLKNKQPIQQPEIKLPNCPSCKRSIWLEFDEGYYSQNFEYIVKKQEHQIGNKVRRQGHYCSLYCHMLIKRLEKFG